MRGARLKQISFLQFIGPIFVILGHSANGLQSVVGELWWIFSKEWIYFFHMPLFFFISGYLAGYKMEEYFQYNLLVKNKFYKLLVPYISWNVLFFVPKICFGYMFHDEVEISLDYFINILLRPRKMFLGHTWFLVALFLTYCLLPIFYKCLHRKDKNYTKILMTILLIGLYFIPLKTMVLTINDLHKDLLFFWIGMIMSQIPIEKQKEFVNGQKFFVLVSGAVITSSMAIWFQNDIWELLAAFLVIMCLYFVPLVFNTNNLWIESQSKLSFVIYILHWPFIIIIKVICYQMLGLNIMIVLIFEILGGYFGPCFTKKVIDVILSNKCRKYVRNIFGI